MNTPICDYVRSYGEQDFLRLHMPGHKGIGPLGIEHLDITEIAGADSLYEADGIIRQSEQNAGSLFGADTFYSTEGSSLCIRAMLYLTCLYAAEQGKKPLIAAGRNAHKTFLTAAALLNFDVLWLYPSDRESYLSCDISPAELERVLSEAKECPTAVYLTAPDYLGHLPQMDALSEVCHRYGVLLLVDNAHGAYLRFLPESRHPIDLGADLCCDSAHKTLPVLTGGAYLHVSPRMSEQFSPWVKKAMAMFGSTSPSYLILQSLDAANLYLASGYREKLRDFVGELECLRNALRQHRYTMCEQEPLKLTIDAKKYGYEGWELAQCLRERRIECEFSDPDYVVLMLTPELGTAGINRLRDALMHIGQRTEISAAPPAVPPGECVMSPAAAMKLPWEVAPVSECEGRILGEASVGCPPAVPIVCSGERIPSGAAECFRYYGIKTCTVIKNMK